MHNPTVVYIDTVMYVHMFVLTYVCKYVYTCLPTYGITQMECHHSLAILLLNSRSLSFFSQQLSVHVYTKFTRVEPLVKLQITSIEFRLAQGLNLVPD